MEELCEGTSVFRSESNPPVGAVAAARRTSIIVELKRVRQGGTLPPRPSWKRTRISSDDTDRPSAGCGDSGRRNRRSSSQFLPSVAGAQRSAPGKEAAVPFSVGETLTYDVSWSSFLVAGTATVRVVEKKPSVNSSAYYIVVEGRPVPLVARLYKLYYKMDTLLDSVTLLSQRGSLYSEEGGSRTLARPGSIGQRAGRSTNGNRKRRRRLITPSLPGTQDGLAVLYALRGRAFKTGESFSIPVADGGALYTVQVQVGALEPVQVPAGQFTAWNMKVGITDAQNQPVWKNNEVWISNDARRLP